MRLLTSRDLHVVLAEYPNVLARAAREGWLRPLITSHLVPCTKETADSLLHELELPKDLRVRWFNRLTRGRAGFRLQRPRYSISLPTIPGALGRRLRIGLVLHEAAHVYDHLTQKKFSHGPTFCVELRRLLEQHWVGSWREKLSMPTSSVREIYARHRGPYWILLTRSVEKPKGRTEQATDKVDGPLSAEEAHEEARTLVNALKDNVLDAMVFSITEGQFIGAFYRRGETYAPWSQLRDAELAAVESDPFTKEEQDGGMELHRAEPVQPRVAEAALLPGPEEPVPAVVDAVRHGVPKPAAPRDRPVRTVPAKIAAGPRTVSRPVEIDPANLERWPASEGARLVREALGKVGHATARVLAQLIAEDCTKAGIGFPASLISRLKQGGFLREVAE